MEHDIKSIKDALALLDSAAASGEFDIKKHIGDYANLKNELSFDILSKIKNYEHEALDSISRAKQLAQDYAIDQAKKLDRSVHTNPWVYIAGAATIAGILGFFLGRKSK